MSNPTGAGDPFEALHVTDDTATPDPSFVSQLRRRLVDALSTTPDGAALPVVELTRPRATAGGRPTHERSRAMSDTTLDPTPTTTSTLTPYLIVAGGAAAIDWYTNVLGAVETVRYDGDDGRVGHSELLIGDAHLHLADEYPEIGVRGPRSLGGTSVSLSLEVDDVDRVYAAAVGAGAEGEREPSDQAYGARSATVVDPFGHRWMLQTFVANPSVDEIEAGMPGFTVTEKAPAAGASAPVELGYFTLSTPDTSQAAAFYGALFGWRAEGGSLGDEYQHVANTSLPLGFAPGSPHDPAVLYYRVADVDAVAARVGELGGRVIERAAYDSGLCIECTDDQGRPFHLWQPAPGY